MKTLILLTIALQLSLCVADAQPKTVAPNWAAWQFMQGKWVGEGSSELGAGSGYFTFEPDLQNKAWIRRNTAEYPATKDRPKYTHEDVMVVYFDQDVQQTRAFYYDTEGHVIHYTATWSIDGRTVTLLGDAAPNSPRYRLTYVEGAPGHMSVTLEMAQPGKPEEFRQIVEGKVRKVP